MKFSIYKIFFLISFLCSNIILLGQNRFEPPQMTPPSPQAEMFEKYLYHKVEGYNGLPDIKIPIYEIKLEGLTIPIYLSYHAGGVKYRQYDGELGAGWSINVGGFRVNRTQSDKPDESYELEPAADFETFMGNNAYNNTPLVDSYLASLISDRASSSHTIMAQNGEFYFKDSSYDLFSYMLPTSSGNFIISDRNSKKISIAELNLDTITYNTKSLKDGSVEISSLTVYDGSGNHFQLGGEGFTETSQYGVPSSWLLKQITTDIGEKVEFNYEFYFTPSSRYNEKQLHVTDASINVISPFDGMPINYNHTSSSIIQTSPRYNQGYISTIKVESLNLKVEFIHKEKVNNDYPHTLDEINITENNKQLKKIKLIYENTPDFQSNSELKHTLLNEIEVYGNAETTTPQIYKFEYYLPSSTEFKELYWYPDMWGYYSFGNKSLGGGAIDENFRDNMYINNTSGAGRVTHSLKLVHANTDDIFFIDKYNNKRSHMFSLKKIIYPTKGSTEYIYEPHQFKMSHKGEDKIINGGGHRIKEIVSKTDSTDTVLKTTYRYGTNEDGLGYIGGIAGAFTDYRFLFADETFYFSQSPLLGSQTLVYMNTNRTYSSSSLFPLFNRYMNISYGIYSIEQSSENLPIGKEVNTYSLNDYTYMSEYLNHHNVVASDVYGYGNWYIYNYNIGAENTLNEKIYINQKNDTIRKEIYKYTPVDRGVVKDVLVKQKVFVEHYNFRDLWNSPYDQGLFNSLFDYGYRTIDLQGKLLSEKIIISKESGLDAVVTTENYGYNSKNQLSKTTTINSNSNAIQKITNYPYDYLEDEGYADLVSRNIISEPIEEITLSNNKEISRRKKTYFYSSLGTVRRSLPSAIQTSYGSPAVLKDVFSYNGFNLSFKPTQITRQDGVPVTYIWGYNDQYIIAEIVNAKSSEIWKLINELGISYEDLESGNLDKISLLRDKLPANSLMTNYTHIPLVGVSSMTDPREITTTYEYDSFGRLKATYIQGKGHSVKKLLQSYDYNYQK